MEPPRSTLGQILTGTAALAAAGWAGGALNAHSVKRQTSDQGVVRTAAALGAATGSLLALFGATVVGVSNSKWKTVAQTTTVLGVGGFAAMALIGLKQSDRMLSSSASQPRALLATESDSGGSFALHVGDTLSIELPAAQAGYSWSWTDAPTGSLTGPVTSQATAAGGSMEQDTWTAAAVGDTRLTAQLVPAGGGSAIATWAASVSVA